MFSGVGDHFRQFWLDLKTSEEMITELKTRYLNSNSIFLVLFKYLLDSAYVTNTKPKHIINTFTALKWKLTQI